MPQYIIQFVESICKAFERRQDDHIAYQLTKKLLPALTEELDRLDPRDFLPETRHAFILEKAALKFWANNPGIFSTSMSDESFKSRFIELLNRLIEVLKKYGGAGSRAVVRAIEFVKDRDLRQIIERDYRELRLLVYPSGAWKSTVILAGSVLEAMLFGQLTADPAVRARAEASVKAPKDKGKVKDLVGGRWSLRDLIDVASDIGILPQERADTINQVLREYRNFVHPKVELRAKHECTEAEAMMAVGALDGVCNFLMGKR
jgi:hypothetical protein